jgi:hypothetical protein
MYAVIDPCLHEHVVDLEQESGVPEISLRRDFSSPVTSRFQTARYQVTGRSESDEETKL